MMLLAWRSADAGIARGAADVSAAGALAGGTITGGLTDVCVGGDTDADVVPTRAGAADPPVGPQAEAITRTRALIRNVPIFLMPFTPAYLVLLASRYASRVAAATPTSVSTLAGMLSMSRLIFTTNGFFLCTRRPAT